MRLFDACELDRFKGIFCRSGSILAIWTKSYDVVKIFFRRFFWFYDVVGKISKRSDFQSSRWLGIYLKIILALFPSEFWSKISKTVVNKSPLLKGFRALVYTVYRILAWWLDYFTLFGFKLTGPKFWGFCEMPSATFLLLESGTDYNNLSSIG